MARRAEGWTCRKQTAGVLCRHRNRPRSRICAVCGKSRPARRRPEHMKALDLPYEHYVELNGSENCGICGKPPKPGQRHHRDHDHRTGKPRGILCFRENTALRPYMDADWCERAALYLRRTTDA